jgi:SAM-dependent methyltransferase
MLARTARGVVAAIESYVTHQRNRSCTRGDFSYGEQVADRLFADPRLAAIYDDIENDRSDLDHYEAIVDELGAASVLDVGCGTGVFACRLAQRGIAVTGIDPAWASIEVARAKPPIGRVTWICGDATALPPLRVDMATMTGNVAQVFVRDDDWRVTLTGVRHAIRDGGYLVFETRDPSIRGWEEWRNQPRAIRETSVGPVEYSVEMLDVELPLVSFRLTYRFLAEGVALTFDSTLRFRERREIEEDLAAVGFDVIEVRDAPDRPGRELVFIAQAAHPR